jgi:hypothetical protein
LLFQEVKKLMATKRNSDKIVVSPSAVAAAPRRKAATPKRTARTSPAVEVISTPTASVETVREVTVDSVSQLAYSYWEARGYQGGSPEEDWLRAEQALRALSTAN